MTTRNEEDVLAALVAAGLERRERGEAVDVEALCADWPELVPTVRDALGLSKLLPGLHQEARHRDATVGRTLGGRYRLEQRIGAGAMGTVYRAHDLELGRDVAVKVLSRGLFSAPRAVERFLREAELLARIDDPHVVAIHDRGRTEDDHLFLVMELLRGASLAMVLQWSCEAFGGRPSAAAFADSAWLRERMPEAAGEGSYLRQVVRWGAQIAEGLAAAHRCGVCHRDVKPSNVFVRDDGRVVLLDFGIAHGGEGDLTAAGTSLGTPWYMSPEIAEGIPADERVDVYGLCATLYHLLTLRPPFDDELARVMVRLLTEDPVRPGRIHDGLPRDLEAIVERGMARRPQDRYADGAELGADLRAFLEHRPVAARPLGPLARVWRRCRRAPARAIAGLALAVAAALALVVVPLWRAQERAARQRQHAELGASVPALLTLEGYPEARLAVPSDEQRDARGLLDRLLELSPDDDGARLLRAAIALDDGRTADAAADLEALAARAPSAYLREVAARFGRARPGARGLGAVDLDGLPEPVTEVDRFVGGFHALRARTPAGYGEALRLLTEAASFPPARDLRMIALLAVGRFQEAHDLARELEGVYGRKTARTRHVIGAALCAQKRFDEAVEPLEDSIALRPGRHGSLHNLGLALLRLGQLDRAQECLERAHAIRPWLWNSLDLLAQLACERGEFARALEYAERIPAEGESGEAWRRSNALGLVCLKEALAALRADAAQERIAAPAERATALFEAAAAAGAPRRWQVSLRASTSLARALANGDWSRAFDELIAALSDDPLNATQLRNLAGLVPDAGLDATQVRRLRILLLELAALLAPGDPRHAKDAAAEREALKRILDGGK